MGRPARRTGARSGVPISEGLCLSGPLGAAGVIAREGKVLLAFNHKEDLTAVIEWLGTGFTRFQLKREENSFTRAV